MTTNLPLADMIQRIATTVVSNWWKAVGVSLTWAYVVQADPLRLRPVGQADTVEVTPESLVPKLYAGDRVLAVRFGSAWVVLGRTGPDKGAMFIGALVTYLDDEAPNELWRAADGSVYDPVAYPEFFAKFSNRFGGTLAAPHLPDTRNRVIVGLGTDAMFDTIGETGGEKSHTQTVQELVAHAHTDSGHSHTQAGHTHGDYGHYHGPGSLNGYYRMRSVDDSGTTYHGAVQYIFSAFDRSTENGQVVINAGTTDWGYANLASATPAINNGAAAIQDTGGGQAFNIVQWYITLPQFVKVA